MASADSASERTPLLVEHVENDYPSFCSSSDSIAEVPSGGPNLTGANKEYPTPLPKLQLFSISFIQIAEPVTASVIHPFVVQSIRDTGVTGGDEAKTGYYAGSIESLFFTAEALTVLWWGRASDYVGRKPPLLIGGLVLSTAITSFGLSKSIGYLMISRCLQGIANGNIGITKSMIAEITDGSNIARAFSFSSLIWGSGVTFGPALGGMLSHPAERWPETFGKIALFRKYPYFLPCVTAGMVPLSACIFASVFLKETLPSAIARKSKRTRDELLIERSPVENSEGPPPLRTVLVPRVLIIIINIGLRAFIDQCCSVLIPLVYATSIPYGGLGLSTVTIGTVMLCLGLGIGFISVFCFPFLSQKLGFYIFCRLIFICYLVIIVLFPVMNWSARRKGYVDVFTWIIIGVQMSCNAVVAMGSSCLYINLTDSAPKRSSLGVLTGLAQSVSSSMRMFAPIAASSLFSLTQQRNLMGGTMVYSVLLGVAFCGMIAAYNLPRKLSFE